MSDGRPIPTVAETCRCGGSTTVTARNAPQIVAAWRTTHPCTSRDEALNSGRSGGGSILGFAADLRSPNGHNTTGVRA